MLKKHDGIKIPNDDPFENDKLNRAPLIENLTNLITDLNQPFVISINSPWGTGKTVFIKMWEQYLKNNNFVTLYFNAWENDFANEPLISLIGEIKGQLAKDQKDNSDLKKCTDNLLKKGSKIIKQSLPVLSKVLVKYFLKMEDIKELTDSIKLEDFNEDFGDIVFEKVEDKIKEYSANRDIQKEFRDVLTKFSETVIKKEKKNRPIVFFVDELDRCRPDYAIKLLESIKHLFNINNFVFVLAIDRKQIGYSVQTLYGTGMDTEGYLKRFIDINYDLPEPSRRDYIEFLYDVYAFSEIEIDAQVSGGDLKGLFFSIFSSIVDILELSLREIEHCLTYMRIVWRILYYIDEASLYLMCFLVPLRIKEGDLCNDYISGKIDSSHLIMELTKKLKKAEIFFNKFEWSISDILNLRFDMNIGIILEYFLETAQLDDYQMKKKYEESFHNTPDVDEIRKTENVNDAKQIIKKWLLKNKHISDTTKSFKFLKDALDFAMKFN